MSCTRGFFSKALLAGSLACTAALLLNADTLTLRNGATVRGTYLGGTARQIRMDQNGDIRTYDLSQVQSVIFTDAEPQVARRPLHLRPPIRATGIRTGAAIRIAPATNRNRSPATLQFPPTPRSPSA